MTRHFATKQEWLESAIAAVATLNTLLPSEFYDEAREQYHSVYDDIASLIYGLENPSDFKSFMAKHVARASWLPDDPHDLDSMDVTEIHYRVSSNIADGRWMDSALAEAFESGSLAPALKRLAAEIDRFELARPR
jgi:hypothetical protein